MAKPFAPAAPAPLFFLLISRPTISKFFPFTTVLSSVTVLAHVLLLPFTSVTVRMTVLAFTLLQLKVVTFKAKLAIPQASEEPLSTCEAVMFALPVMSNCTVMFWQTATGATLSSTVITVEHVVELPFTSVTVKTSVLAPTSAQTKVVWLKLSD